MDLLEHAGVLGDLHDAMYAVDRTGASRLVLVSGEPGVGKTALVNGFCGKGSRVDPGRGRPVRRHVCSSTAGAVLRHRPHGRRRARAVLGGGDRRAVFDVLLDEVAGTSGGRPQGRSLPRLVQFDAPDQSRPRSLRQGASQVGATHAAVISLPSRGAMTPRSATLGGSAERSGNSGAGGRAQRVRRGARTSHNAERGWSWRVSLVSGCAAFGGGEPGCGRHAKGGGGGQPPECGPERAVNPGG